MAEVMLKNWCVWHNGQSLGVVEGIDESAAMASWIADRGDPRTSGGGRMWVELIDSPPKPIVEPEQQPENVEPVPPAPEPVPEPKPEPKPKKKKAMKSEHEPEESPDV